LNVSASDICGAKGTSGPGVTTSEPRSATSGRP
jgi:hypothetical protein